MAEAIVLRGPSQTGKSTFMNMVLLPGDAATVAIGDGSGESVTHDIATRRTSLGLAVDGPGDNDSMMRFTIEEAGRRYAAGVAALGVQWLKFLIFESLASPAVQLRASLASLVTAFGASVLPGVVVVASQADLRTGPQREVRLSALRAVMAEQGITELVLWQHADSLDQAGVQAELAELQAALQRVPSVSTSALEDLWQRQRQRAQELCDRQPPRTRVVQVEEQFAEPYTDQEAYQKQEPYTEQERYTEQVPYTEQEAYEENEPYIVTEYQSVQVAEEREERSKKTALGQRKTYTVQVTKSVPVQVQRRRPVTRHREVTRYRAEERTRPVTRYRAVTRQRDVTRYRTAMRTVDRTVEYFLPVEDFHQPALEAILAEVRASFRARADVIRPEDSVSQVAAGHAGDSGAEADDDSWSYISPGRGVVPTAFSRMHFSGTQTATSSRRGIWSLVRTSELQMAGPSRSRTSWNTRCRRSCS
ncbi:unnamed protein product [Symbiodinium sp. CCMP2456]|nr:unnamed protein product [Symbiodinium sp. CCMP2456]